ncbi:phosphopeptide-binding protein [Mycolicibacterium celeriflavum]|uniref:MPT63 family protein n=1 Tax=Mycolicibacterium celeriflavum TaxID=1249101 RepID=UPI0007FDF7CD|nr:MPT63 family protein [Mycolicibacterium celeriflavum]OBG15851.1 phosphopeptide-binding protein [Mycolicibacterium celeriflavum]
MKITKITSVLAAAATAGFIGAPLASAEAEASQSGTTVQTQTLGSQGKLVDGAVIQGWTITDLKPSSDAIPYPVTGKLWEATATDQAIQGSATPIVSNLNARAADGQTYRALFGVATPQGVNPSTLAPGQQTSGKVYFDVTGAAPDSVVYNAGGQDRLVWTEPPASDSSSSSPSTSYDAESEPATAAPAEAEAPAAQAPEGTTAAPAAAGAEVPEGSQGTPLPEGSEGTPIAPEGAATPHGTPVQPAEAAPAPAGTEGVPQPAGSHGTPLPAGDQVQTPNTYIPTPTP